MLYFDKDCTDSEAADIIELGNKLYELDKVTAFVVENGPSNINEMLVFDQSTIVLNGNVDGVKDMLHVIGDILGYSHSSYIFVCGANNKKKIAFSGKLLYDEFAIVCPSDFSESIK